MTISFWLNNKEETEITSFYDMVSNPFNVGDVINLDVEELYPSQINSLPSQTLRENLIEKNKMLQEKFKRKDFKIVREGKYLEFDGLSKTKLTIEYHCEEVIN